MSLQTASIGIPDRFEIEDGGGTFRIHWKWPRLFALPLAIFSAAWDTFLVSWYVGAMSQESVSITMLVFPIGHLAVGVVLPYVALAYFMNHTIIEVGSGELNVTHQPLPFPGRRMLRASEVRQLFCVERTSRKGAVTYDVMAQLGSMRETKLVSGLATDREARFIEQRIEARLGLTDRSVSGELPR